MTFDALGIAGTGMNLHRHWLDSLADNIANVNTAAATSGPAFQAKYILAQESPDNMGVQVAGAELGDAEGRMVYEPDHPLADEKGYVKYPDIDLSSQMSSLIMAQRGYQANAAVIDRAKESYQAALQIGK